MAETKTRATEIAVGNFLSAVEPPGRREDGLALDALFRRVTGWQPRIWGASIVGYGRYAYTYESGHSGETCATGFSPRKANLVLYVLSDHPDLAPLLARLGKHKIGKSCLYLNRLADIDTDILAAIIRLGLDDLKTRWPVHAT